MRLMKWPYFWAPPSKKKSYTPFSIVKSYFCVNGIFQSIFSELLEQKSANKMSREKSALVQQKMLKW